MKIGLVLLVCVGVQGGVQDALHEGRQEGRENHDQIQDEILKAMKDSGVLNEWKDKLDDMLYEGNDIDTEGRVENYLNKQEEEMIRSFVEAYTQENKINVNTNAVVDIVRRVQKTPSPNLPMIFVQLTPLIDVISAIGKKSSASKLTSIIERQAPVFESPAKTKDILHTLTENLKSELVRLTLDTPAPKARPAKAFKTPPTPPKKAKKSGGLDMADYLTLGSTLLKGGNAGQIMSLLSGESDMGSMMSLLPQLMEAGNYKDILGKMVSSYLDSSPYGPLVKNIGEGFFNSEQGKTMMTKGYSFLEVFVKSESGRRLANLIPKIIAAKTMEDFLEIVHEEAEWNWSQVFENIENSDYKEKSLEQLSEYLVLAYEYLSSPPKGSVYAKVPILVNGFLISNGVPPFDMKKPVDSITAIINKGIKLFSTTKLDVSPHVQLVSAALQKAVSRQTKGLSISDLSSTQKKHMLARLLDSELVEPMQSVWRVYTHSVPNLDCAQHLLCQVNFHARQEGIESRIAVVKGTSLAAAWTLSQVKERAGPKYWNLYKQAVWRGASGEDCMSTYKVKGNTCNIFPWQESNFMSTSYEHIEL